MNGQVGFFEEGDGVKSITRLKTFMAAIAAILIALCSVFVDGITIGDALPMVVTLLAYSAGTKVFQKFAEVKTDK